VQDGFADDQGVPIDAMPSTRMEVDIVDRAGGGVVVTIASTFASVEAMEQLIAMGMEQGMLEAMGQIDAVLAA
jgi:uncharacterized protein YndB with AHSA1/START domain